MQQFFWANLLALFSFLMGQWKSRKLLERETALPDLNHQLQTNHLTLMKRVCGSTVRQFSAELKRSLC